MADKPILFSAPMVRALLDGTKTQTRRVLRPQPEFRGGYGDYHDAEEWGWEDECGSHVSVLDICPNGVRKCDRLWVREAWRADAEWDHVAPRVLGPIDAVQYEADGQQNITAWGDPFSAGRYRHALSMPRWASRLTLTVTDVRVQRLQEISEADARAEGVSKTDGVSGAHDLWIDLGGGELITGWDAREVFAALWNHIYVPGAWAANHWVAAYTFTVHHCNIGQMPGVADGR